MSLERRTGGGAVQDYGGLQWALVDGSVSRYLASAYLFPIPRTVFPAGAAHWHAGRPQLCAIFRALRRQTPPKVIGRPQRAGVSVGLGSTGRRPSVHARLLAGRCSTTPPTTLDTTIGLCTDRQQLLPTKYLTTSTTTISDTSSLFHSSYHNTTLPRIFTLFCVDEHHHDYNLLIHPSLPFLELSYSPLSRLADWSSFPHRTCKLALCPVTDARREQARRRSQHLNEHILTSIAAYRIPQSLPSCLPLPLPTAATASRHRPAAETPTTTSAASLLHPGH